MKKILFTILFLMTLFTQGQDPSFSQFDLNMMYSNPAFSGYEGTLKPLLHSRNQWNKFNEKFNNSIFEISTNIKLNPNRNKDATQWSPGLGLITEDLRFKSSIGNDVFINKIEASLYLFSFHKRIDFKIGKLKAENLWLSFGTGIHYREYNLITDNLIFSGQWDDFGYFTPANRNDLLAQLSGQEVNPIDLSSGFILTQHGKYQNKQGNRRSLGWSLNHITRPSESFSGNIARIPMKSIIHANWTYEIPLFEEPFIKYFKAILKHERYIDNFSKIFPWKKSLINKTEFGAIVFINNKPIELGTLYRIDHNFDNDYHMQKFIPLIRYRFNRMIVSYSYDMNVAGNIDRLTNSNTGTTHEMGIIIYLYNQKNRKGGCPAFMENSALFKDIYDNGLINTSKPKRNFK